MAENEGSDQLLNPGDKKTDAATDDEEGAAKKVVKKKVAKKKVTKKRAAKKKVVKKSAVTKRVVTKKTAAAKVASSASASAGEEVAQQETGQGGVEAGVIEERSESVAAGISGEVSEVTVNSEIKEKIPAATGPSELPREEKVTMSADASKAAKSSPATGFGPKVIIWIVVVLAAFMYIRSLAHKGETVKRSESPVPAVVSQTAKETTTTTTEESSAPASDTATGQSTKSEPSTVAKVGEVAIAREAEAKPSAADSESLAEVSVGSGQAVGPAKDSAASSPQQASTESESVVQEEVKAAPVSGFVSAQSEDSGREETAAAEGVAPVESPESASAVVDAAAVPGANGGADVHAQAEEKVSEIEPVREQKRPPVAAVGEAVAPGANGGADLNVQTEERVSEIELVSEQETPPATVVNAPSSDADEMRDAAVQETSAMGMAGDSGAAQQGRKAARESGRPSFKELFGYERPKPPVHRQDQATHEPFARDNFYPAPWSYPPRQPAWGGEYPGQYGPYGNYGAYPAPAYPGRPEWAPPYQPYGYGPSGY